MATDILELALRNEDFANDCMANPELSNKAIAIIDRIMDIFGKDIHEAKIDGPLIAREGFDVAFKLSVRQK